MLLTLQSLTVQGFRSFTAAQSIELASAPGLVYVTGINEVEPELGANGVGKSSLFEALHWVLYGRTSTSLRAGDTANWTGEQTCRVVLLFKCDAQKHVLQRTWKPNTLTLDGIEVTQEKLDAVIGLREASFQHAVFHAQFVPQFADLAPAAQLEAFSEVLNLDVWEDASEAASREAREVKIKQQDAEVRLARTRGELVAQHERLDEAEVRECLWWREYRNTTLTASRLLWQAQQDVAAATVDKQEEKAAATLLQETNKAYEAARDVLAANKARVADMFKVVVKASKEHEQLSERTMCPTCQQPIDRRFLKQHFEKEAAANKAKLEELTEADGNLAAAVEECARQLHEARGTNEKQRLRRMVLNDSTHTFNEAKKKFLQALEQEPPDYVTDITEKVAQLEDKKAKDIAFLEQCAEYIADCEFWNKAFREIRLSLVQQALTQLELVTNTAASALGLHDWEISYAVEGETKGGKATKGFAVHIGSPHNTERVPFAAWSGGERQRLRLAITLGFADLIQDYAGVQCNIEVFDEPTAWLSQEGVEGLVELLAERATFNKTVLYLADHRALDSGDVARIVYVRKTATGTILEQE